MREDLAIVEVLGQRLPDSDLSVINRFALVLVKQHIIVVSIPSFQFGVHRGLTKAHEFLRQRFRSSLLLVYDVVDHLKGEDLTVERLLFGEYRVFFYLIHFDISAFTEVGGLYFTCLSAPHHLLLVKFAIFVINIHLICSGKCRVINIDFQFV